MKRAWKFSLVMLASAIASASGGEVDSLDLAPGFPRTIFFRSERWAGEAEPEEVIREMERFDAVSIKLFNEAPRQRYRDLVPKIVALKRHRPSLPVLVHVDHFAAVRPLEGERLSRGRGQYHSYEPPVFPGHWLYHPFSKLSQNISAKEETIPVVDTTRFQAGDDVRLVAADALKNPPRWLSSEVVFVEKVDNAQGCLKVRRGCYETGPAAFAGGTLAIPHAKMKYGNPAWYWSYNLDTRCPRDEEGRPFWQWFADWVADEILAVNREAGMRAIDGVEFDVTKFNLVFGQQPLEGMEDKTAPWRGHDCDLDGVEDGGYAKGRPTHGFGTIESVAHLRERLGDDYLITGDSIWTLWRPWEFANGMDNESFPDIRKDWRWSGAFERMVDWSRRAAEPRMSFIFTRATEDRLPGQKDAWQTIRHALGVALLTGAWHCLGAQEGPDPRRCDEYSGGDLGKTHWLGRPLGDFVRMPRCEEELVRLDFNRPEQIRRFRMQAAAGCEVWGPEFIAEEQCLRVSLATVREGPEPARVEDVRLWFATEVAPGAEYTVAFRARAEHDHGNQSAACRDIPWGMTVSLWTGKGGRPHTGQHNLLVPAEWRPFHIGLTADPGKSPGRIQFEFGDEPGTLYLDDIRVFRGSADIFYRRFEGGLVLVNGSRSPAGFDHETIEPERALTRLRATQKEGCWQSDPEINTGEPVEKGQPFQVAPFDALLFKAEPR